MNYIEILEKGIWGGCAALGFAVLFNVPQRTLFIIWLIGAAGTLTKALCVQTGINVILASFAGASLIGILSIPAGHNKQSPPLVFFIPSLIPMVPGVFGYRTMLGIMKLAGSVEVENYSRILNETVNYGIKTLLVTLTLAAGASIPMLLTRKTSARDLKIRR